VTEPFIFIGTHKLKEGKLEEYKKGLPEFVEFVEANEPRLIAFNMYLDEEGDEVSIVQVHPDVDSMEFHMRVMREHIQSAYAGSLESTTSIQVYGELSDAARDMMKQLAGSGVQLIVKPQHLAGFTRSSAE
jgi:hypothetical protein